MVEISLSTPRVPRLVEGVGGADGANKREKKPVGGRGGEGAGFVWSMDLESQLLSLLAGGASAVAPGKAGREELDFNHAARVAWSTGHASAEASASLAILVVICESVKRDVISMTAAAE
jgi:hypothetical protein